MLCKYCKTGVVRVRDYKGILYVKVESTAWIHASGFFHCGNEIATPLYNFKQYLDEV